MGALFRMLVIMMLLASILAFVGQLLRSMGKRHHKNFDRASNVLSAIGLVVMVVIAVIVLVGS